MRFVPIVVAAMAWAPSAASADVFKIYAEAHGGGMAGKGTGGDLVNNTANMFDEAFFEQAPHGTYGAAIGARFLFLDGQIRHDQFTDGKRLATWTAFLAGLDFELPVGSQTPEQKKAGKGSYVGLGIRVGFGLGTGQQVMPPLSYDELTDKGFLVEGALGFGKHVNKVFDVGITVPVSYGYFFKSGGGAVVNDLSTHYQSLQASALLVLRANIRLF